MAGKQKHELYRMDDGMVGGVCAGLADSYDVDIIVPRILAVLITLTTFGLGAIAYLVLWVRLPVHERRTAADPFDIEPDLIGGDARESTATRRGFPLFGRSSGYAQRSPVSLVVRVALGVSLAVLFLIVAAMVPPFIPGTQAWQLWPVVFLAIGVFMVIIPTRSEHEMLWHVIGIVVTSLAAMALPMSLDLVSWHTVPTAFRALWFLIVIGAIMLIVGIAKSDTALMVGGAVCIAAFCLITLLFLAIPGGSPALFIITSQGLIQVVAP